MEKSGPNPGSPPECGGFRRTTLDWTRQFGLCDTEKVWVTSLVDSSRLRWNLTESGRSCGAVYSPRYLEQITKEDLEEPTFDLIDWYKQTIDERALLEFKDRNGDDMVTMSSDEETSQDAHEGSTCQCHRSHCFIGCDQSEEIE